MEDWRKELENYHQFLGWDKGIDYLNLTQDEARERLKQDLKRIANNNGFSTLFSFERNLAEKLDLTEGLIRLL